jgi:hypothetical protein
MTIDDNILAVSKCIFQNREHWQYVTDKQKKDFFFIFNRYLSKRYPYLAQMLNDKLFDEISGMNLIYAFFTNKPYPKWFWSKSEKKSEKTLFSNSEIVSLQARLDINKDELDILLMYHLDEVKEEIKWMKSLNEQEK